MKFSDEQRKAILSDEPFLFLQACAGSGKTRVIVERVKRLISEGVESCDILCLTFTKKASLEMYHRLNGKIEQIYTFHQFCYKKLKELTYYPFDIMDGDDVSFSPNEILKVSNYKNTLNRTKKPYSYEKYELYLRENQLKDFDDLLIDYLKLELKNNYRYILIDEFQDTNQLQYEVIKKMIKKNTQVFTVGDPNQSIYRFRGSNYQIIHQFVNDYQAKILTLSMNYRSTPEILYHANALIKYNPKRDYLNMLPYHKEDEPVESISFKNKTQESEYILNAIKQYIYQNRFQTYAILYRHHERAYHLKYQLYTTDDYTLMLHQNVDLLTIHQAKGLEFDFVCLIGLEQGELPSTHENQAFELEEERRLCFVGMTRAKKKLILTHVTSDDSGNIYTPSVFLRESRVKTHDYILI